MIDNNLIENQIRPQALGRENYLFAGSHQGAKNAAIIYLLIRSCQRNNNDPFQYLYAVLNKIPDHPINKISDLLPLILELVCKIYFPIQNILYTDNQWVRRVGVQMGYNSIFALSISLTINLGISYLF